MTRSNYKVGDLVKINPRSEVSLYCTLDKLNDVGMIVKINSSDFYSDEYIVEWFVEKRKGIYWSDSDLIRIYENNHV